MRRTIERGTKARLIFCGGSTRSCKHGRQYAGSWTASGSEEAMEVPKNFKDLRKLVARNIAQQTCYSLRFFPPTFTYIRHVYRSVWPAREAKPRFGAALERSAHDCETR